MVSYNQLTGRSIYRHSRLTSIFIASIYIHPFQNKANTCLPPLPRVSPLLIRNELFMYRAPEYPTSWAG